MQHAEGDVLFERYRIAGAVKTGGMGAVYRAQDLQFPDRGMLALKEMLADFPQESVRQIVCRKFAEEARVLVRLSHPGIPRVWDHFVSGDLHYIVMEFIEGTSLDDVLRDYLSLTGEAVPLHLAVEYGIQLCQILEYLHTGFDRPILHRDLKPANVIVRPDGHRVVLVDFGLARGVNPLSFSTRTVVGTIGYASLEQLRGQPDVRSDVYSLGATLHHLVGGQPPVPFEIPRLQGVLPSVPPALAAVVDRAVAQDPSQRFPTAAEMRAALEEVHLLLKGTRDRAPRPSGAGPTRGSGPTLVSPDPSAHARAGAQAALPRSGGPADTPAGRRATLAAGAPAGTGDGTRHSAEATARPGCARPRRDPAAGRRATASVVGFACAALALLAFLWRAASAPLGPSPDPSPVVAVGARPALPSPSSPAPRPPGATRVATLPARPGPTRTPAQPPAWTPARTGTPVALAPSPRADQTPSRAPETPVAVRTVYVSQPATAPAPPPVPVPAPSVHAQAPAQAPTQVPARPPVSGPAVVVPAGSTRYQDPQGRFELVLPPGYALHGPGANGDVEFQAGRLQEVRVLAVTAFPDRTPADQAIGMARDDLLARARGTSVHGRPVPLLGKPAFELDADVQLVGVRLRVQRIIQFEPGGTGCAMTAAASSEMFATYHDEFRAFFESLRFHF